MDELGDTDNGDSPYDFWNDAYIAEEESMCVGCSHCSNIVTSTDNLLILPIVDVVEGVVKISVVNNHEVLSSLNGNNGEWTNGDDMQNERKRAHKEAKSTRFAKGDVGKKKPPPNKARAMCRKHLAGGCTYGVGCKFSHDLKNHKCAAGCPCGVTTPVAGAKKEAAPNAGAGVEGPPQVENSVDPGLNSHPIPFGNPGLVNHPPPIHRIVVGDVELGYGVVHGRELNYMLGILPRSWGSIAMDLLGGLWYLWFSYCFYLDLTEYRRAMSVCMDRALRHYATFTDGLWDCIYHGSCWAWHWCCVPLQPHEPDLEDGLHRDPLYYTSGKSCMQWLILILCWAVYLFISSILIWQLEGNWYKDTVLLLCGLEVSGVAGDLKNTVIVTVVLVVGMLVNLLNQKSGFIINYCQRLACCVLRGHFTGTGLAIDSAPIRFWSLSRGYNRVEFDGEQYNCYHNVVWSRRLYDILAHNHPGIKVNTNTLATLVQTLHNELGDELDGGNMNIVQQTALMYIQDRRRQLSRESQAIGVVTGFNEA